jgi:hypothetical protein
MKRRILNAFMLIGFIVAATAAAQAQGARRMVVNVPFDFIVGKRTLPAGTYVFKKMTDDNDKPLLVRSADGHTTQIVLTSAVEAARATEPTTRLDFRRYGDQYFLVRVWSAGQNVGRELSRSPLELVTIRELARTAGQGEAVQPQTISVKGHLE